MLKVIVTLLIAAVAAAVFGFSGVADGFADTARLLFFLFLALLVLSSVFALLGRAWPGASGAVRTLSLVALVAIVSVGVYAWIDNDMSAERAGRVLDRGAEDAVYTTTAALGEAGDRTQAFIDQTVTDIRTDASKAADEIADPKDDPSRKPRK